MHSEIEKVFFNDTINIHHDVKLVNILKEEKSEMIRVRSAISDQAVRIIVHFAKIKANQACFGYLYEPSVPKKLRVAELKEGKKVL